MRKIRYLISIILIFAMVFTFAGCREKEADVAGLQKDPNTIIKNAMQNSLNEYRNVAYNPTQKGTESDQSGEIVVKVAGQDGEQISCTLTASAQNNYFKTQYADSDNDWGCLLYKDVVYIQPNTKEETYYSLPLSDLKSNIENSQLPQVMNMEAKRIAKIIYSQYQTMLAESAAGTSAEDVDQRYLAELQDLIFAQPSSFRADRITVGGVEQNTSVAEYAINNKTMLEIGLMLEQWQEMQSGSEEYINDVFYEIFAQAGVGLYEKEYSKEMMDKAIDNIISDIKYDAKYYNSTGTITFYLDAENKTLLKIEAKFTRQKAELQVTISCDITFAVNDNKCKQIDINYELLGDASETLNRKIHWTYTKENQSTKVSELVAFDCRVALSTWKEVRGIEYNKNDSSFVFRSMYNNEELILTGNITAMDDMRMQIDHITYANKEYDVNISITGTPSEIKCKAPNAESILGMDQSALKRLQNIMLIEFPEVIFGSWASTE